MRTNLNTARNITAAVPHTMLQPKSVTLTRPEATKRPLSSASLGRIQSGSKWTIPLMTAVIAGTALTAAADPGTMASVSDYATQAMDIAKGMASYAVEHPVATSLGALLPAYMLPSNWKVKPWILSGLIASAGYFQYGLEPTLIGAAAYTGIRTASWALNKLMPAETEESLILRKMPWLNFMERDLDIPETRTEKASRFLAESSYLVKSLPRMAGKKAVGFLRAFGWQSDELRGNMAKSAAMSKAAILAYTAFRIGGTMAVWTAEGIGPESKIAALLLLSGEWVRILTGYGFAVSTIKALRRDSGYFNCLPPEQKENLVYSTPTALVHFIAAEEGVSGRAIEASFLVNNLDDNGDHVDVWGANADWHMLPENEMDVAIRNIVNWSLDILDDHILPAQEAFTSNPAGADEELDRLMDVLEHIRDQYRQRGLVWMEAARSKAVCTDFFADSDTFLGEQWLAHANRWQMHINALEELRASGNEPRIYEEIDRMYEYLRSHFDFDVLVNVRPWTKSVALDTYGRIMDTLSVAPGFDSPITNRTEAEAAVDAAFSELHRVPMIAVNDTEDTRTALADKAFNGGLTPRQIASEMALTRLTQTEVQSQMIFPGKTRVGGPRVGGKSWSQSNTYSHFGKTVVSIKIGRNIVEMAIEDAERLLGDLMTAQENARTATIKSSIPAELTGLPALNNISARNIVTSAVGAVTADPEEARAAVRSFRRMEKAFVRNGKTGDDLATWVSTTLALRTSKDKKILDIIKWTNPDLGGEYDKDYAPNSIDRDSLELKDIFRRVLPPFFHRWASEGRTNIAIMQSRQDYATTNDRRDYPDTVYHGVDVDRYNNPHIVRDYEPTAYDAASDQLTWYGAIFRRIIKAIGRRS